MNHVALPPIRVLSLCAGVAGLDLGLRLALPRARTVCYVERDIEAAGILAARAAEGALVDDAPIWSDLTTFDGRAWRGAVDLVMGGFPCQPWSGAGKRLGTSDERWLWPAIAAIVCDVGPGYVFLENVPPLLLGGIEHVLGSLAGLGFHAEWAVFSAAEVGAPHLRERLFILAYADGPRSRERVGPGGESPRRGQRTKPSRREMADAEGARLEERDGPGGSDKPGYQRSGGAVADADGARLAGPLVPARLWRPDEGATDAAGHRGEGDTGEAARRLVADADELDGHDAGSGAGAILGELGEATGVLGDLWPPGPDDADGWRRADPDLAPATQSEVRRVADMGLPRGWCSSGPSEMASCRWLSRMRGELSRLERD